MAHCVMTPTCPKSKDQHRRSHTLRSGSSLASLTMDYQALCDEFESNHSNEIEVLKEIRKLESFAENENAIAIAQYIKDNETIILSEHLTKINEILFLKPYTFVTEFANNNGLTHLCSLSATHIDTPDILQHILLIFDTILNETNEQHTGDEYDTLIGFQLVLSHSHSIQCITDMFESNDKNVMGNVLKLLTTICVLNKESFEILIKALYSYGDRHNASSIFDAFVRSMFSEHDLEYRRDALKFINAVLNFSPNLKCRVDARRYLTELGLQNIMHELWDIIAKHRQSVSPESIPSADDEDEKELFSKTFIKSVLDRRDISRKRMLESEYERLDDPLLEDIREQLRVYGEMEEMDHNDMLWNNIDLDDPKELINYLFMKAVHQQQTTQFMDTLIGLCSIPDSKSHLWSILPRSIVYLTGNSNDCIMDELVSDNIYDDVDALKSFLDTLLDETQNEKDDDIQRRLKQLETENDNLKKETIELKQKIRKLAIREKLKREKDKLQQKLFEKYHASQKPTPHCIVSPTDKIIGHSAQILPTFSYSHLSVSGTKSFQPQTPKISRVYNDAKKKKSKRKRKQKKAHNKDLTPELGQVPIVIGSNSNKSSEKVLKVNFCDDLLGTVPTATNSTSYNVNKPVSTPAPIPNGQNHAPLPVTPASIPAPVPNTTPPAPIPVPLVAAPIPAPAPAPLPGLTSMAAPIPASNPIHAPVPLSAPVPIGAPVPMQPPCLGAPSVPGAPPKLIGIICTKKKATPPEYISKPRRKMNFLQWQHIKKADKDTVWNEISLRKSNINLKTNIKNDNKQLNHDHNPSKRTVKLNIDHLEAMFGKKIKNKSSEPKENTKKRKGKVTLLDSKRSYNLTLCLSRLHISHKVLKCAILALSEEELDSEQLSKLHKLVPTTEEQELLRNYSGDPKQLALAERFVYELRDIRCIGERLEFWQFKIHFKGLIDDETHKVILLQNAYNTIKKSDSFKTFLQYVLLIGNYMNYDNAKKGNVDGFQLKSLLSLENSKSVDKKDTLLSFIIKQCNNDNPKCLEFVDDFCRDLGAILDALKSEDDKNKIDIHQLTQKIAEFGKMRKRLQIKIKELKNDDETDMFEVVMNEFLDDTKQQYMDLVENHKNIMEELIGLSRYFGNKNDKKLVFIETLLMFSKMMKCKVEDINEIELRQKKAAQKVIQKLSRKKREEMRKKGEKLQAKIKHNNKDKESKKEKEKKKNDRLLELYHRQKKMMNVRSRALSISISRSPREESYQDKLLPPNLRRTRSSLTMEMLESITSDEIKKRREDRKIDHLEQSPLPSPLILKRSPSFLLLTKRKKDKKTKHRKKKKKKGVVKHLGKWFNKQNDKQ